MTESAHTPSGYNPEEVEGIINDIVNDLPTAHLGFTKRGAGIDWFWLASPLKDRQGNSLYILDPQNTVLDGGYIFSDTIRLVTTEINNLEATTKDFPRNQAEWEHLIYGQLPQREDSIYQEFPPALKNDIQDLKEIAVAFGFAESVEKVKTAFFTEDTLDKRHSDSRAYMKLAVPANEVDIERFKALVTQYKAIESITEKLFDYLGISRNDRQANVQILKPTSRTTPYVWQVAVMPNMMQRYKALENADDIALGYTQEHGNYPPGRSFSRYLAEKMGNAIIQTTDENGKSRILGGDLLEVSEWVSDSEQQEINNHVEQQIKSGWGVYDDTDYYILHIDGSKLDLLLEDLRVATIKTEMEALTEQNPERTQHLLNQLRLGRTGGKTNQR